MFHHNGREGVAIEPSTGRVIPFPRNCEQRLLNAFLAAAQRGSLSPKGSGTLATRRAAPPALVPSSLMAFGRVLSTGQLVCFDTSPSARFHRKIRMSFLAVTGGGEGGLVGFDVVVSK